MALNEELVNQLVKATNDRGRGNDNYTVYGKVVTDGSNNYVRLDGSEVDTPVETTVEINPDDRVIVEVKNHTATVTGNISDPAVGVKRAGSLESKIEQTASNILLQVSDTAAGLSSKIELTANEIRSEVSSATEGLDSKITQNANSITSVVKSQEGFSQFQQTVEGFSFMGKGGTVKIKGGDLNLTGAIKFSDLSDSSTVQSQINSAQNTANSASSTASSALSKANSAASDAEDALDAADEAITLMNGFTITSGSKTYIDGEMIYVPNLHLGGQMDVYTTANGTRHGGYIGYCEGFNSNEGIGIMNDEDSGQCICTDQAARLSYGGDCSFVATDDVAYIDGIVQIDFEIDGDAYMVLDDTCLRCHTDNIDLGWSQKKWQTVYAIDGEINTSDRNEKNSIEDLPEKYITMFDRIQPKRFKLNSGKSGRYHVGYIAQEVEEAMQETGLDSQDFGGFVKDKNEDGSDMYMLRYSEFGAIYAAKIKQLEARIAELEERLANIEYSKE